MARKAHAITLTGAAATSEETQTIRRVARATRILISLAERIDRTNPVIRPDDAHVIERHERHTVTPAA